MKRALYVMAVVALVVGVSSQVRAEEEHGRREGHAWFGTFEKTQDGKIVFKSNNESHAVSAGEKAKDDVKNKLTNAEKELVGQGTFQVYGNVKESVLVIVAIAKKGEGKGERGERKEGGDHKEGEHKEGGDHKEGHDDKK
jgi:hypothetical protein